MSKTKINFEWNFKGTPIEFMNITVDSYERGVYAPMMGVSQVVRQFIKTMFPEVGKFQISTDSFSMGDSVNIYLNDVDEDIYDIVSDTLREVFERGNFNGMIDLYEYHEDYGISTEVDGNEVTFSTKYFHTQNTPKFGTKAYDEYKSLQS